MSDLALRVGIHVVTFPVAGNLALSRAIGDFEFKRNGSLGPEHQIVTANPDIIVHQITDEDEFLVLACDGAPSPCLPPAPQIS